MPRGPGPSYLQLQPSQEAPPLPSRPPLLRLRSSPLTRRGYRGTEISGFVTLYLSQASAVGSDRPGLAQRRRQLFCISHKAKKGFGIPVAVRWEYELPGESCVFFYYRFRGGARARPPQSRDCLKSN